MTITYSIYPSNPEAHLFEIALDVTQALKAGQQFSLPAWIPGSYMIRDFAKNIIGLSVNSNGQSLAISKIDKDTWQIEQDCENIQIHYQVYAFDLSVRSAHLDNTHGFFNGTSVFLRVHGLEQLPCAIHINKPKADKYKHWRIATSLINTQAPLNTVASVCEFGEFTAENYYDLIEHPVEMGSFDWFAFEACGVPHYVALTGRHSTDIDRLKKDLKTICEHHIRFFGEPAPIDRYVFLVTITGDGYGGLEHTFSTALLCSRKHLPSKQMQAVTNDYREFLGLCSHEYFHTWNVKRLKPSEFMQFDLNQENYSEQLWAFEGITSYYDDLALLRTGIISLESYCDLLSKTLTRLQQNPGRLKQTVSESSFYAWTKFYKQDENAINAIVSYYSKGAIVALLIDLKLRQLAELTLDDVMQSLWQHYLTATAANSYQGLPIQAIENEIVSLLKAKLTADQQGQQDKHIQTFKEFLYQLLHTTEELPVSEMLATIGIKTALTTAYQKNNAVDKSVTDLPSNIGVKLKLDRVITGNFPTITHVYNNSAAEKAGLAVGDCLVAINGIKAQLTDVEQQIASLPAGQQLDVVAFRRDELMQFEVILEAAAKDTVCLSVLDDDPATQAARNNWQMI